MKKLLLLLFITVFTSNITAQDVPLIKVGEIKLGIAKLDVKVKIIGNIVSTTYDMQFYNPTNNILEGELIFPLKENQSVSRFALNVNGKIREAVVVEKEQGRIAFEAVVRRRVDPALLEKGTGNTYRARIYPIPRKGYKQIIIEYQEELKYNNGRHIVTIPQSFENELETYNLDVTILNQPTKPKINNSISKINQFKKRGNDYYFSSSYKNFKSESDLILEIPLDKAAKVSLYNDYLYAYKTLENNFVEKEKPSKVKLLWDVSYSMKDRDTVKEFQYLDNYFKRIEAIEIEFVKFSNTIIEKEIISIKNGNWKQLKNLLVASVYDGGTSYDSLLNFDNNIDEILLFTDGMYTLSEYPKSALGPVFVINSIKKANHNGNKLISTSSQGNYLNLSEINIDEAIKKTFTVPLQFMGFEASNSSLELYPVTGSQVYKDFSVSVKGVKSGQKIKLNFGFNNSITETVTIIVPEKNNASEQIAKIWAGKKVLELQKNTEENKNGIVALGKQYQLITDHTSLIVLEDVYDYIKYDITPPEELMAQYLEIKKSNNNVKVVDVNSQEDDSNNLEETIEEPVAVSQTQISIPTGSQVTISGIVLDNSGIPLPGVNVIVSGTSNGTQTDFDGNFRINVSVGEVLVFSYVGFVTLETTIQNSGNINISMGEDSNTLDEIVVTALGIKKEKKALGYSVSTITEERIDNNAQSDIVRVLEGKVAGVQITNQNGMSGSSNQVIIRGMNSFTGNNNALFIIDGVPYSNDTNTAGSFIEGNMGTSRSFDIDPNNIESIDILKGLAATTIYGTEGRNGVILITTKTGAMSSSSSHIQKKKRNAIERKRMLLAAEKTIDEIGFSTPYLKELKSITNQKDLFAVYLKQRSKYANVPSYFVDVYDYIKDYNIELANRILSNIAEIDMDNYELLKVYAYKLEEQNNYQLAVFIYRQVLKLRSEDSQSYRDLALALQETGAYNEALDLLNSIASEKIYKGNQRRNFKGLKDITINEMRNIIHTNNISYDIDEFPLKVSHNYDMDIRVVIDWNHNDTDIDLHIIDPNLEECSYTYTKTKSGGEISKDMTKGFGPEEFKQKFSYKGSYYVKVNYYGDRYQKVETPTFMKVTIFRNYGRVNQEKEVKVIRLTGRSKKHLVERIVIL